GAAGCAPTNEHASRGETTRRSRLRPYERTRIARGGPCTSTCRPIGAAGCAPTNEHASRGEGLAPPRADQSAQQAAPLRTNTPRAGRPLGVAGCAPNERTRLAWGSSLHVHVLAARRSM